MRAVPWARPPRLPVCSAACTLRRRLRARVLAGIGLLLPRIASVLVCGWVVCICSVFCVFCTAQSNAGHVASHPACCVHVR